MKIRIAATPFLFLFTVLFAAFVVRKTPAATVTTLNDSGAGSLRAAIANAVSGETIQFAVTGTVMLTSGELVVSVPLTIAGPGADQLTIRRSSDVGVEAFRIFNVLAPGVVISDITVSNGWLDSGDEADYGAGISNQGGLTLLNCAVVGNKSASSYTRGTGIYNAYTGALSASACLLAGNIATGRYSEGSAIYNFGSLELTNCTISGNAAGLSAAIQNDGLASGDVVIESCTVVSNYARVAAGLLNHGSSGSPPTKLVLHNSIVAANSATNADWDFENRDIENLGLILSGGFNLIGSQVTDGPRFNSIQPQVGDRIDVPREELLLGPLASNGGPTLTHALRRNSAAVNAGPLSGFPPTDQRGVARPQFTGCDIGAFEADAFPSNLPPTVRIIAPTDGETRIQSMVLLVSEANDPDGKVVTVEYFVGANSIGIASNAPIQYMGGINAPLIPAMIGYPIIIFPLGNFALFWNPSPGHYVLTAKATDNDGGVSISEPVEITIVTPAVITIKATDPNAAEPRAHKPADVGKFTISRTGGNTNFDLAINFFVEGTAMNGVDYELTGNSAVIPAGRDSVQIVVQPLGDSEPEETESVSLQLAPPWRIFDVVPTVVNNGQLYPISPIIWPPLPPPYERGTPSKATVYIRDNDGGPKNHLPSVRITQPAGMRWFSSGSNIRISAETTDRDSYVEKIEFFDGAKKIGESVINFLVQPPAGSPVSFDCEWTNVSSGMHMIRARATDTNGGIQVSPPVRIWVQ
jgi:hypothetical protein